MRLPLHAACIAVTALVLPGGATAQSWQQTPVPVTDGPLLFLESYIEVDGQRWNLHHVCDPRSGEPAREFLRLHGNLNPLHRFGRDLILVASYHDSRGLLLIDLGEGTWRTLSPGNPHELVAVRGDEVIYVSRDDGHLESRNVAPESTPRRLLESPVQEVVAVQDDDVVVLTAGTTPEIWIVPIPTGKPRKVTPAAAGWIGSLLTARVAPDRQHLALGVVDQNGMGAAGNLLVYALDDSRLVCTVPDIPIGVSPLSSFTPRLRVGWSDGRTVRFSQSRFEPGQERLRGQGAMVWVDLDVESGKRIGQHEYGPIGLYHSEPDEPLPPTERYTDGLFDREPGRLYLRGATEPLVDVRNDRGQVPWGDLVVGPNGHWACVLTPDPYRVEMIDGRHGTRRTLLSSWAYDVTWLR